MLSYSKLITQLQTLILFSNLFFPSKLKGVFRPFWTWLYKLTILYWKPDFRPTCMLKSYTMLIKWGTFLTSKTLLFKSLINDDKVFDTCNLSFQKKSKNSTVFWAKQNGKRHQLRRWVVKCMVLQTENSRKQMIHFVSLTSSHIPVESCMQELNQLLLGFYEGLKVWIIINWGFDNL